jgi:hypothetical protein
MSVREQIDQQLEVFPLELQQEVLDFTLYLRLHKLGHQFESILASASALQDWLSPEEDEAWKDL